MLVLLKIKGLETFDQKNSHNAIVIKFSNLSVYLIIFSMKFYLSKGFEQY